MTKEQSEAEKAAEEYTAEHYVRVDQDMIGPSQFFQCFIAGAAWAAPKWKCPPEYPNEGDLIVVKRHDEGNSFTYHLSRSVRSIPVLSSWMVIEPAAPEVEK